MNLFKKTETYIGAAALALVAGLANCPGELKSGPSFEVKELKSRRTLTRTGIDEIFRNLEDEEEEFTVSVPVNDNGEIPKDFAYMGAVRDCVESTGLYHCSDIPRSTATRCYSIDEENPVAPVDIVRRRYFWDEKGKENISVGYNVFGHLKEGDDFDLEGLKDAQFTKGQLNSACRVAITLLEKNTPFEEICRPRCTPGDVLAREDEVEQMFILNELGSELFEEAKEAGIEVEDKGGNVLVMNLSDSRSQSHLEMDYVYSDEERAWVNIPALIVTNPSNYHEKTFYDPEEVLDYLIELDLKNYENEQ